MTNRVVSIRCTPPNFPSGATTLARVDFAVDAPQVLRFSVSHGFSVSPEEHPVGPPETLVVLPLHVTGVGVCMLRASIGQRYRTCTLTVSP